MLLHVNFLWRCTARDPAAVKLQTGSMSFGPPEHVLQSLITTCWWALDFDYSLSFRAQVPPPYGLCSPTMSMPATGRN